MPLTNLHLSDKRAAYGLLLVTLAILVVGWPASAQNPAATVAVDAQANRHPISPNIYGVAFASTGDVMALHAPLNRYGGNSATRYNWQLNADNRGNDWYFETYPDTSSAPGFRGDDFITTTRAAAVGAQPLLTIPMINYLGSLGANRSSLRSFSIAKYGPQTGSDPYNSDAGNGISTASGNPFIKGNNPLDANVANSPSFQMGWVQHLISTWGTAANGGLQYYIMDNEPSIWHGTHRDVHPTGETYSELYNDFVNYAGGIRNLDPNAMIVGPEEWGWLGLFYSGLDQQNGAGGANSDYNTHAKMYHYPWLLQQLHNYQVSTGTQLLNVLSVHYYPQDGSGGNDDSAATQLIRNRSTRSLWDPTYVDQSWINQVGINSGIVNLIPNLKSWVNQYYPGLEIGITEYNWGDEANLNGATTQADALGIFGREGLDLATRWTVPANPSPTYLAMQIYRNYDGKLSTFGDASVAATVANPDKLSSFAAVRGSDGALTVMVINKQTGSTPVTISLANFGTGANADAWQIASATQTAITHVGNVAVANNAISTTLPSQSITLFVIPPGNGVSIPPAPTGLAAAAAAGSVTLTWNPAAGATSYSVKRATASTGPFGTIGTVTSPSPTTFTDSGLTNGVTYFYEVSATNSAGTSPNSAVVSATPAAPATFTSSAMASPNPDTQGAATTITATVTCTGNTLTNGNIQVMVLDPSGNSVVTQNFTAQNFAANQSHTYTASLTPSAVGNYTVEVGVFTSSWQMLNWNSAAGTISVRSSTTFSSTATATPSTISQTASSAIALKVTDTGTAGLTNANVELQIFDATGHAVATNVWSGQNFTAGQALQYSYTWTPGTGVPAGTYSVEIGVFNSSWSTDYHWNSSAASIKVTTPQSPPAAPTGLTAKAGTARVSLTWKASSGASYNVYRGTSAGAEGATPVKSGLTSPSFTDTGLTTGTTYYYKVAAVNAGGTSALSSEASAKAR
ncbi:MAG TPA: glycoside hydrolase family 44 protein [Bryobacteraceae bacterium]|nr:glycoside hydrolase family 44 protein [Bryobacteraceae bacterium]